MHELATLQWTIQVSRSYSICRSKNVCRNLIDQSVK